ncbi:MAG: LeuA family protein [Deltaproteobacteria bacterium]|nr:LeuA family protein [Deltaproteobacteria bacterium]
MSGGHGPTWGMARSSEGNGNGEQEIVYDWNMLDVSANPLTTHPVEFFDETLRDGIQSPSVVDPTIEAKLELIHLMDSLGIHVADVALPAAGKRAQDDCEAVCQEIVSAKLSIRPAAAARTVVSDIEPIAAISQRVGIPIEVYAFIGSSPIRQLAEDWDLDRILKNTADSIDFAVKEGLPITYVTEDTTRSQPSTLDKLFRTAIGHGAHALCLSDTVGHATPDGVRRLIHWTKDLIRGMGEKVRIDWHGHNDRGLGVVNAIFAAEFGADRVHGTGLGVGERVGNAAIDQVLLNFKLLGAIDNDLTNLLLYCQAVSRACAVPIPYNYPLAGTDAFRTATGVHAAAIIKAEAKGDAWLADRIYSAVPATEFGKEQEIEIGHYSGLSNVRYWLEKRRLSTDEALVKTIFDKAKSGSRVLTEDEVMAIVRKHS